jgi:hypothetical protein
LAGLSSKLTNFCKLLGVFSLKEIWNGWLIFNLLNLREFIIDKFNNSVSVKVVPPFDCMVPD